MAPDIPVFKIQSGILPGSWFRNTLLIISKVLSDSELKWEITIHADLLSLHAPNRTIIVIPC